MGSQPPTDKPAAEQDLLFGIFAVQLGLASPNQVMLAASQWAVDRSLSLSERLEQDGVVPSERAGMLREMVSGAVAAHGGDARDALDTFGGEKAVSETFGGSVVLAPDGEIVSSQEIEALKPLEPTGEDSDELAEGRLKVTPVAPGRYSLRDRVRGRPTNLTQAAEIGRGGIGRVMVAFDEHLGREVAVKELLPVRVGGSLDKIRVRPSKSDGKLNGQVKPVMSMERVSALVARFLREARVTGQLEHPNIVPVYELGRSADDTLYYTMKMVRGRTLAEALEACGGLTERLALLPHFVDLCQAIAYAHSRGVVHRDLKPENVMLGEFGETVVLDWGLAKVRGSQDLRGQEIEREIQELRDVAGGQTVDGTALGTPAYMSPEQAEGDLDAIDERSDVWSLGAVLFQILTGRPPYEGATAYEVIGKVLKDPVRPVTEVTPTAPGELAAVCNKALSREPRDRYQGARELASEVNAHLTGGRVRAYDYSFSDLARRLFARYRVAFVTGGISLLLLISLGVWSYLRVVADRDRAQVLQATAEKARTDARLKMAEAHWEGARAAKLRRGMLEARAKLRSSLEVTDSVAGRVLWAQLRAEPLVWKRVLGTLIYDVTFSPDGTVVAAAGMDGSIYLLDARSGEARVLRGHKPWVASLAYSPDGERLASAGADKTIRIWDLSATQASSTLLHTLEGHTAAISDVTFSVDGRLLVSSGHDRTVRLWRVASGAQLQVVADPPVINWILCFTPDGKRLLSGDRDGNIRVYRLEQDRLVEAFRVKQPAGGVAGLDVSADGQRMASGSNDHAVYLWDMTSLGPEAKPIGVLAGHTDGIGEVAFSPDGAQLASASYDKTVRLWTLDADRRQAEGPPVIIREHTEWIAGVSFHHSGEFLATAGEDRAVALWRLPMGDGARHLSRGHTDEVAEVTVDPTGAWIASGGADHQVRLWELATGRELAVLSGPTDTIHGLAFTPDGRLRAATWDRRLHLWAPGKAGIGPDSPRSVQTLPGDGDLMTTVAFSDDGRWVAAGDYDRTVRLWDLKESGSGGQAVVERVLEGHTDLVREIAFDPSHPRLATASWDRTLRVWDLNTGRCLRVLKGHTAEVNGVVFTPDGRSLISTAWDHTLRLWSLAGGPAGDQAGGQVIGKPDTRYEVMEISPDGRWLACGNEAGLIELWDLSAGAAAQDPRILRGHHDLVADLAFTPDGSQLVSTGDDGTVRVWDVATGQPHWRAPLLLPRADAPPLVYTHQGWIVPGQGPAQVDLPERAWRRAAQAARTASLDATTACTISAGDRFEMWDLGDAQAADRLSLQKHIDGLTQVLAFDGGCAVLAAGEVTLYHHQGLPRTIAADATALGRAHGDGKEQLLVAAGGQVRVFETSGLDRERLPADVGVTALTRLRHGDTDSIAVGYRDGTVELTAAGASERRTLALEQVSSSQVVQMLQGPAGTLILGYADGLLGLWDVRTGARLDAVKLHGGLAHAAVHAGKLYVVTELGDHLAWDLSIFHADYCGLLKDVWDEVPVAWEDGRPTLKAPPKDHPCRD